MLRVQWASWLGSHLSLRDAATQKVRTRTWPTGSLLWRPSGICCHVRLQRQLRRRRLVDLNARVTISRSLASLASWASYTAPDIQQAASAVNGSFRGFVVLNFDVVIILMPGQDAATQLHIGYANMVLESFLAISDHLFGCIHAPLQTLVHCLALDQQFLVLFQIYLQAFLVLRQPILLPNSFCSRRARFASAQETAIILGVGQLLVDTSQSRNRAECADFVVFLTKDTQTVRHACRYFIECTREPSCPGQAPKALQFGFLSPYFSLQARVDSQKRAVRDLQIEDLSLASSIGCELRILSRRTESTGWRANGGGRLQGRVN